MTPDELKKQLAELGVNTGQWAKTPKTTSEIKLVQNQKKQLLVIRNMLQALADPNHPDHEDLQHWTPLDFDPAYFDVAETNAAILSPRPFEGW